MIAYGVVESATARRRPNSSAIQTDLIIAPKEVTKGKGLLLGPKITVVQAGGTLDGVSVVPADHEPMAPGESYVLFLRKSANASPTAPAPPRFYVLGTWAGKIKIEGNRVVPDRIAGSNAAVGKYEKETLEAFVSAIRSELQ